MRTRPHLRLPEADCWIVDRPFGIMIVLRDGAPLTTNVTRNLRGVFHREMIRVYELDPQPIVSLHDFQHGNGVIEPKVRAEYTRWPTFIGKHRLGRIDVVLSDGASTIFKMQVNVASALMNSLGLEFHVHGSSETVPDYFEGAVPHPAATRLTA